MKNAIVQPCHDLVRLDLGREAEQPGKFTIASLRDQMSDFLSRGLWNRSCRSIFFVLSRSLRSLLWRSCCRLRHGMIGDLDELVIRTWLTGRSIGAGLGARSEDLTADLEMMLIDGFDGDVLDVGAGQFAEDLIAGNVLFEVETRGRVVEMDFVVGEVVGVFVEEAENGGEFVGGAEGSDWVGDGGCNCHFFMRDTVRGLVLDGGVVFIQLNRR